MPRADLRQLTIGWCAAFLVSALMFQLWPGLDLAVSGAFYRPGQGFPLAKDRALEVLRQGIWWLSNLMVAFAAIAVIAGLAGRPFLDRRRAALILLLYLIGPVLLADAVLKRFWGRARPASIEDFGGTQQFTLPLIPADQCQSNCSFVSGEGAAATALAIAFLLIAPAVRQWVSPMVFRVYVAFAVAVPLTGMALRVMLGRHFLSDTVFAALLVSGVALILARLLLTRPEA
ncbi:MAG TPA: phosphatase PAP2 family protein [Albidovulum sp.]|uniref:phosphatase PAP2 family protein n=1 Tax=Albidovulum sp. TaxID=1872424 RepID=UPI002B703C06|nr:phosphatase PAP2 family protein [Albidovulum sp.]